MYHIYRCANTDGSGEQTFVEEWDGADIAAHLQELYAASASAFSAEIIEGSSLRVVATVTAPEG